MTRELDPFLQEKFYSIQEKLKRLDPEEIRQNLYTALSFLCQTWSAFQDAKEQKGWSESLYTDANTPVFSPEDSERIEEAFLNLTTKKGQAGGGTQEESDGFSLDGAFDQVIEKLDSMDQFWNSIAYENPGIYKLVSSGATPLPPPFPPVPIPNSTIITFFTGLLEMIRMFLAVAPSDFRLLRYGTTLLIMLDDAISGNWRQLLLSSLGFYSQMGMFVGVTGRIFLSAWLFMNPSIRTNLTYDLFRGFKSGLVGFLLWAFTVLAPFPVKIMVEQGLERIKQVAESMESKIQALKDVANPTLNPLGYELRVKLDIETLKQISLADIQNIQTLATWGNFICANEIQGITRELTKDFVFRVILELLGIPTTQTHLRKICGPSLNQPLVEVLKQQVEAVPLAQAHPGPAVLIRRSNQAGGQRRRASPIRQRNTIRATRRVLKHTKRDTTYLTAYEVEERRFLDAF